MTMYYLYMQLKLAWSFSQSSWVSLSWLKFRIDTPKSTGDGCFRVPCNIYVTCAPYHVIPTAKWMSTQTISPDEPFSHVEMIFQLAIYVWAAPGFDILQGLALFYFDTNSSILNN